MRMVVGENGTKFAVVIGGAGSLGRALVSELQSRSHKAICIDHHVNPEAHINIASNCKEAAPAKGKRLSGDLMTKLHEQVVEQVKNAIGADCWLDGIYCVAGGWEGGSFNSPGFGEELDRMWMMNVEPSLLALKLATHLSHKAPGHSTLVQLTSAKASLGPTPSMLAYGIAKSTINQIAKSSRDPTALGLSPCTKVLAILPEVLDTPANRTAMPNANTDRWIPLSDVAKFLSDKLDVDPPLQSGQLFIVQTSLAGSTKLTTFNLVEE